MFESIEELSKWQPPQHKEIIHSGILPAKGKLVLAGEESVFKTMLSICAGFRIARGELLFGFRTSKVRVGMIQSELTKYMFRERIMQHIDGNAAEATADIRFATELDIKLNKPVGIGQLAAATKKYSIELLIIDPLYKVLSGDVSSWLDMNKLLDNLDALCWQFGCTIWLVHHRRKHLIRDGEIVDYGSDELIGSSALKDWADTIVRVERLTGDDIQLLFPKVRNAKDIIQPVHLRFNRKDISFSVVKEAL